MKQKQTGRINFRYYETPFRITDSLAHKVLLSAVMAEERVVFTEINYIFCNDEYLHELNVRYLNHDTLTDILTFTLSLPSQPFHAEIYISVERVKENAHDLKEPLLSELRRVMIHGLLHLCGYEDSTSKEKERMRQLESRYMSQF